MNFEHFLLKYFFIFFQERKRIKKWTKNIKKCSLFYWDFGRNLYETFFTNKNMEILLLSTFNISFCTKCSSDFSSLYELASPMFCIFLHQLWPRWKRHPLRIAVGQDILKPSIAPWIADWGKIKIKNYLVIRASISQPHRIRAWSSLKGTQFIRFFRTELRLSQSILSLSLSHAQSLVYIGTYEYLSLSLSYTYVSMEIIQPLSVTL